ncbi:hypothetical protein D7D52_14620 [Nocardia yunnanensis]|uniref:PPM-type phosphatase domain-containing protein n=1 Tax=Nocardia yunnanensis TaxID=2382165 RepID=A0A386ZCJ3_9NOCA|nr:PP2C family protein-serine/threonine phosphatase [Nocardia yunnanensis]AYF74893.1 hypothetical protein D7D52_14620 [Nocardia yunnanensis]
MEAERTRLLAAEQAARARLQQLYRLTEALASATTLPQVVAAVRDSAPATLNAAAVSIELYRERLAPVLDAAEEYWAPLGGRTATGIEAPGQHALTSVALIENGRKLGTLAMSHAQGQPPDAEHVSAVAQQIAQAVRRAASYEHEHRVAERLQRNLLPVMPSVPEVEIASAYASGTDLIMIGGDWYDMYELDRDHVGFSIGDVAGHGLPEATVMAQLTAALRAIVPRHGRRPATVLGELNQILRHYHPGRMATACYLVYHHPSRTLRYSKAGHPSPLVIGADNTARYLLDALSPPLGAPVTQFDQAETILAEGDTVLLYTDGLIERHGEDLDIGFQRLLAAAQTGAGLTNKQLCDLFLHHRPDSQAPDDRALMTIRFRSGTTE